MLEIILTLLVFVLLGCVFMAVYKALEGIAKHMQGNPEARKAIIDHVFLPLFGKKKEAPDEIEFEEGPPGERKDADAKEVF